MSATDGPPAAEGGRDVVLCVPQGAAAAEAFVDLTGRPLVRAADLDEAGRLLAGPGVRTALLSVGAAPMAFTASAAYRAHHAGRGLGWVFGWDGPEAALAHARKIAGFRFRGAREALVWSSQALPGVREAAAGGLRLLSGPIPELATSLAEPRLFTALSSHGLGIDLWLGSGLLCSALDAGSPRLRGQAVHPCLQGGPCLRGERDPGGPGEPDRLAVTGVASAMLVLDSCRGLRLAPRTRSACLASAAALGPHAGVVLAPVSDVEGVPGAHLAAGAALLGGAPAHRALALENRVNLAAMGTAPWLLLGDPLAVLTRPRCPGRGPARGRSVDGTTVLFPATPEGTVTIVSGEPERPSQPRVWVGPIPGTGRVAVVTQGLRRPVVRAVDRAGEPACTLHRELLSCAAAVATSARFAATAAELLGGADGQRARQVADALDEWLRRAPRLRAGPPGTVPHGGWDRQRDRWYRAERRAWQGLHDDLADVMSRFTTALGPLQTAFHLDARVVPGTPGEPAERCPYCRSPAQWREFRLDALSRSRRALLCWACDLVYDGPADRPAAVLCGPAAVRGGEAVPFVLRAGGPARAGAVRPHAAAVRFAVERVPWRMGVRVSPGGGSPESVGGAGVTSRHLVTVDQAPPGLYFLVGSLVVGGEAVTIRRPLHLVPPDGAG
ncbi:hypothetical protein AQ490_11340 [Wenjunlia vitaminophila]|uniref:Uncharacterized protein n=1 Tax=Wenjunlia vitaminophila TaxID=76728 RepID=A0A0T6LKB7_WENVI|nr:hypothetical protein [Wenjunlia vitaminophila]KRV46485.1 hypothetical protein AQ490_11340 [Wenjunlia vitaminophila]